MIISKLVVSVKAGFPGFYIRKSEEKNYGGYRTGDRVIPSLIKKKEREFKSWFIFSKSKMIVGKKEEGQERE